jgi:hypothetical protein
MTYGLFHLLGPDAVDPPYGREPEMVRLRKAIGEDVTLICERMGAVLDGTNEDG